MCLLYVVVCVCVCLCGCVCELSVSVRGEQVYMLGSVSEDLRCGREGTQWRAYSVESVLSGVRTQWRAYSVECVLGGVGTRWRAYSVESVISARSLRQVCGHRGAEHGCHLDGGQL